MNRERWIMNRCVSRTLLAILLTPLVVWGGDKEASQETVREIKPAESPDFESIRAAVIDLIETFGEEYSGGSEYLARLAALETAVRAGDPSVPAKLKSLRRDALLANPLMDFDKLILLKRKRGQLGLPTNHQCNAGLKQFGYDNELAILSPVRPNGRLGTLFRPSNGGGQLSA